MWATLSGVAAQQVAVREQRGPTVQTIPVVVATVGSGLAGGVLFAFSTFVMAGLARLPDPAAIRAMQAI
ncbi:MAG: hypothetical protein JWL64_624, partial [Frankiales bacterium]|nr:hypothetical protein [Frankiales bacterium]